MAGHSCELVSMGIAEMESIMVPEGSQSRVREVVIAAYLLFMSCD
jgi:hypothetical protein